MTSLLKMQVEELGNAVTSGKLPAKDHRFATDLVATYFKRALTSKQAEWVGKLLDRANAPAPTAAVERNVGSIAGVIELFRRAREHLKYPAILLLCNEGNTVLRINEAGAQARVPGSLNVCDKDRFEGERRVWYGRVTQSGEWQPNARLNWGGRLTSTAIGLVLKRLAENPAEVAAEFGRLMGYCCFCGKKLVDERSTAVGYGKICAGHYGLPWGEQRYSFSDVPGAEPAAVQPEFNDAIGF